VSQQYCCASENVKQIKIALYKNSSSCCSTDSERRIVAATYEVENIDRMPDIPYIYNPQVDVPKTAPSHEGMGPHIIHGSLGPPKGTPQPAS